MTSSHSGLTGGHVGLQVHVALVREWDNDFMKHKTEPGSNTKYFNIVFSFRGTEPWEACDWLADLNYLKREIEWWRPEGQVSIHYLERPLDSSVKGLFIPVRTDATSVDNVFVLAVTVFQGFTA